MSTEKLTPKEVKQLLEAPYGDGAGIKARIEELERGIQIEMQGIQGKVAMMNQLQAEINQGHEVIISMKGGITELKRLLPEQETAKEEQ